MNDAIKHSNGKPLTNEETKEFKKMYYAIVKAMHPDLHPNQTQEERELFVNAIKAYKNGDIATIRLIFTMRGEYPLPENHEDATKALYREKERLNKILQSISDEIATIKTKFPYNMREFLNDEKQVIIIFSRLMDAGKLLFGRIITKDWKDEWLKIDIKIYLHE